MSTAQSKRLTALEKTNPTPPETWEIIHQIVRPDLSTAGYMLHTTAGFVELAPGDPRLKDCEPATPSINGGYRLSDWIEMGNKPHG